MAYGVDEAGAYSHSFSVSAEARSVAETVGEVLQGCPADLNEVAQVTGHLTPSLMLGYLEILDYYYSEAQHYSEANLAQDVLLVRMVPR